MARDHTTTSLLASLKRRGLIPSTDEALATADFLALATEEQDTYIVPLLISVREEYLVAHTDLTIVSGQAAYPIPPRAIGGKLRDVRVLSGADYVTLDRTEPERNMSGYSLSGNDIVLSPTPAEGGTLRVSYFRRPSALVATTACVTLTAAYAVGSTALVTSTIPATFTNTTKVDVVGAKPGFSVTNDDLVLNSPSGTACTIASPGLLTASAVGDYVCLAGETCVPQIPVELHALLAQRVTYRALEALGDPRADAAKAGADEMAKKALMLLQPRVESQARVLVNRHGPGFGSNRRRY